LSYGYAVDVSDRKGTTRPAGFSNSGRVFG